MKKKNKAGIVAAIVLGVLCAAMIALCVVVYLGGSAGKLSQKARTDKKSDFKETEDVGALDEYSGTGEDFEIVVTPGAPEAENGEAEQEAGSDYLCPESDQRELTEADVTTLQGNTVTGLPADKSIVQMVINEMYAKKGYQFEEQAVQEYFNSKTWYQEIVTKTDDMDAVFASMTDVEKANVEFLQTYEQ